MSGPTNHQLKRALEEIRDAPGGSLSDDLACDILANSPTVLTMLANKLADPQTKHSGPFFSDVAATLRFLSLSNRCEEMPTVELRFKSQRDLGLFMIGLLLELGPWVTAAIGRDSEAALRDGFSWAGIRFKLVGPALG